MQQPTPKIEEQASGPDNDGFYRLSGKASWLLDSCYHAQLDSPCARRSRNISDYFLDPTTLPVAGGNHYHRAAAAKSRDDRANAFQWVRHNYFLVGLRDRDRDGRTPFELAFALGNYAIAKALMVADYRSLDDSEYDACFAQFARDIECECTDHVEDEDEDEEEEEVHRDAKKRRHAG